MARTNTARVVFAGTPDFAVPSLEALLEEGFEVVSVLTQPDRRAGRGRSIAASPVKQLAVEHGLTVLQPEKLDSAFRQSVAEVRPDLLVVVAYGLILPTWALDWPKLAAINVHASLLPRWRGAAPIQRAILAGDEVTGVSIMRVTAGLDQGPVYLQRSTPIGATETAGELHDRISELGAAALIEALPGIVDGTLDPTVQDDALASYAPKLEKSEAVLDWSLSAVELERCVRGLNPWPVAETRTVDGERLRVWEARVVPPDEIPDRDFRTAPGTVVPARGTLEVATGAGLLRLIRVQRSGGKVMTAEAYLAAHDLRGSVFVGPD